MTVGTQVLIVMTEMGKVGTTPAAELATLTGVEVVAGAAAELLW